MVLYRVFLVSLLMVLGLSLVACDELERLGGATEEGLVVPPPVAAIIRGAESLNMEAVAYLDNRRQGARAQLEEIYDELIADALNDMEVERLKARLDQALDRLDANYEQRKERLEVYLADQ